MAVPDLKPGARGHLEPGLTLGSTLSLAELAALQDQKRSLPNNLYKACMPF